MGGVTSKLNLGAKIMLKKILATVSVAAMVAGGAQALVVQTRSIGNEGVNGNPTLLAAELDYAGGTVESGVASAETRVAFFPTAGLFPTGNVLVHVTVSGAEFASVLDGSEVNTATSVISSGGAAGGTDVVFLVSGANACTSVAPCFIDLPLVLDGSNVSFAVGLQTDAGAPVDNSSATNRVTEGVVQIAPAFDIAFTPDTTASTATLASLFTLLTDGDLGDFSAAPNEVTLATIDYVVKSALDGTPVSAADVDTADGGSVVAVVSGFMDAFNPVAAPLGGDFTIGGTSATVSNAADTATRQTGLGTHAVIATPDTTTIIPRSAYTAVVTITPDDSSNLVSPTSKSGSLQSITRDGTSVVFPWTQSATQGANSGATSVFRIGNLDNVAAGAVFVEVKSSADGAVGYSIPGIQQLATSIPANGEFVINSGGLEAELGNYGRGDLEFTIEADPDTLTGRQFVVRGGVIQQVVGGTISQDLN